MLSFAWLLALSIELAMEKLDLLMLSYAGQVFKERVEGPQRNTKAGKQSTCSLRNLHLQRVQMSV